MESGGPSAPPMQGRARHRARQSAPTRTFGLEPRSVQGVAEKLATALCFSEAVDAMKAGKAVRRACGRRLYVFMAREGERFSDALGCTVFIGPDDVLATDWEVAGEAIGRN